MTVIAWDGTALAADKRMVLGNTANGRVTKIHLARGHLTGFTGDACDGSRILHWFREGVDPAKYPIKEGETNSTFVVVSGSACRTVRVWSDPTAAGSRSAARVRYRHAAALAAMTMGPMRSAPWKSRVRWTSTRGRHRRAHDRRRRAVISAVRVLRVARRACAGSRWSYPLFYRCGECHYEWHRDWVPHYRVEMEALAKPHMDPSRHAAYIAAHRGRILQTTRSGQERTTHG